MAIIRNDRMRQEEPESRRDEEEPEEEIDYEWHPTEDEFTSPITAEQWAELLGDASFADTDAARAVRCLHEYGGPATFQQLSIRYRGTMGRYRRWLVEAAHVAGDRYGVAAPQQDQFGMDEWWPLLYVTRNTGKPGAGIVEMVLRPEVEEAYEIIAEQERQAKRAENVRNLQRIEQLERARQEERKRVAEQAAQEAARLDEPSVLQGAIQAPEERADRALDNESEPSSAIANDGAQETTTSEQSSKPIVEALPALTAFLDGVAPVRFVPINAADTPHTDAAAPIDYALRYAERLREALALMGEALPGFSAARVARELGDESVQALQEVLNGQQIPSFAYLDKVRDRLFISVDRLEAPDGYEQDMPVFLSLDELGGSKRVARVVAEDVPREIAYVVDDAKQRRTGVILRFGDVRCAMLTRAEVPAETNRRKRTPELELFVRMVEELDSFANRHGIERSSYQITADQWDALVLGEIWPGAVLE